jgi:integrase
MKLTQHFVETAKPPQIGQEFFRDDALTGFALRVTANGAKSFIWEGRVKGRPRRITLGQYPDLTVLLARKKALEIRAGIAQGHDPASERQALRREPTLGELVQAYIERHAKPHKRSWREDERLIARYVPKGWYGRALSDISHDEVARLHGAIGRDHGQYGANHLVRLLRAMLNLGRDWGYLRADNPATRIKLFKEEKRERYLSADELRRVNEALTNEPNEYWQAYFPLSLLLGARKSELLSARWADIDLDQKTWRIPETKAGRSHLLPLPEAAVGILSSLPSRESSEWVFPGRGSTGHLVEPKLAWQRIRKAAGVPDVRIHDLRRTLGSWLAGQGYSLPLIGRALNHSNVNTTQIYARLDLDPVREALERNSRLMFAPSVNSDSGAIRNRDQSPTGAKLLGQIDSVNER